MSWRTSVRRGVALTTLISFFTACYTQRPLGTPVPAPATRVIAEVTDVGAVAMGSAIGAGAHKVEGVVAEADTNTWRLHLVRVEQRGGTSTSWNRELVSFPRNALTNAREKRLDKKRSWITAGIITAALVALTALFGSGLAGGGNGGGPVDPA